MMTRWFKSLAVIFLTLTTFVTTFSASAKSSVWQVSKGSSTLYIAGTVHILRASDFPLPTQFYQAYQQADKLIFETDIGAVQSFEFQQSFLKAMMLPADKTLSSVLSATTIKKLEAYVRSRGLSLLTMEKFTPALVSINLTMLELQRLGISAEGVDKTFYQKALSDGKPTGYLETPQQQINYLANMGKGQEDQMILYSLQDAQRIPEFMDKTIAAWRKGDNQSLMDIALVELKREFPSLFEQIIVERNNNWLPQITAMLATPEREYILVGGLHLVGDFGVLHQLKKLGYQVKQLN